MKKFKFNDWLKVKVVLKNSLIIPYENPEIKIVSLDEFNLEDRTKIQTEQRIIFKELFQHQFDELMKDFTSKLLNSKTPIAYKNREIESLKSLIDNKFICKDGRCISPVKIDNKTFTEWYYKSMMEHNSLAVANGGIVRNYDGIPSPKSDFSENGMMPPEVMISVFSKMLATLNILNFNNEKRKKVIANKTHEKANESTSEGSTSVIKSTLDIHSIPNTENENISSVKNNLVYPDGNDEWKRYFIKNEAYDFFLKCKNKLKSRGKKSIKTEKPSELSKYSVIFNFMISKGLIFPDIKHKTFIDYLRVVHSVFIPSKIKKFTHQTTDADKDSLKDWYIIDFPNGLS
jgi:hypothetical protein